MSSMANATAVADVSTRKCSFCAEEILAEARKCKHCGEFVERTLSVGVGGIFAAGVIAACIFAGSAENSIAVALWAIFVLLFAKMFARV